MPNDLVTESNMVVLFDGGCPMCSREIRHYRRLSEALPIEWIDVTSPAADLARFGLNREEALQLFHVVDQEGTMHEGARAFIALWSVLPGYRWLAKVCRSLGLAPLLESLYVRFAAWHYRRRCREGLCNVPPERPGS